MPVAASTPAAAAIGTFVICLSTFGSTTDLVAASLSPSILSSTPFPSLSIKPPSAPPPLSWLKKPNNPARSNGKKDLRSLSDLCGRPYIDCRAGLFFPRPTPNPPVPAARIEVSPLIDTRTFSISWSCLTTGSELSASERTLVAAADGV